MSDGFKFEVGQRVLVFDKNEAEVTYRYKTTLQVRWYVVRWPNTPYEDYFSENALSPIPVRHEFGVVVFEETGEKRPPRAGEWFAGWPNSGLPMFCESGSAMDSSPRVILRPVEIKR